MKTDLLKEAKKLYPKGSHFLSASGILKSPIRVSEVKLSENYKNIVINSSYGILYIDGVWAERL